MISKKIKLAGIGMVVAGAVNASSTELFSTNELGASEVQITELCCGYVNDAEMQRIQRKYKRHINDINKKAEKQAKKDSKQEDSKEEK